MKLMRYAVITTLTILLTVTNLPAFTVKGLLTKPSKHSDITSFGIPLVSGAVGFHRQTGPDSVGFHRQTGPDSVGFHRRCFRGLDFACSWYGPFSLRGLFCCIISQGEGETIYSSPKNAFQFEIVPPQEQPFLH